MNYLCCCIVAQTAGILMSKRKFFFTCESYKINTFNVICITYIGNFGRIYIMCGDFFCHYFAILLFCKSDNKWISRIFLFSTFYESAVSRKNCSDVLLYWNIRWKEAILPCFCPFFQIIAANHDLIINLLTGNNCAIIHQFTDFDPKRWKNIKWLPPLKIDKNVAIKNIFSHQ